MRQRAQRRSSDHLRSPLTRTLLDKRTLFRSFLLNPPHIPLCNQVRRTVKPPRLTLFLHRSRNEIHYRRIFLLHLPDSPAPRGSHPLMRPERPLDIYLAKLLSSFSAVHQPRFLRMRFRIGPRLVAGYPVRFSKSVIAEQDDHTRDRHIRFPVGTNRLAHMGSRVFPYLPIQVIDRKEGILPRPRRP
jgi:hypothetical protein